MNTVEQYNGLSQLKPLLPNSLAPDLTSKLAFENVARSYFSAFPKSSTKIKAREQNKSYRQHC